jgi:hypothetical protein
MYLFLLSVLFAGAALNHQYLIPAAELRRRKGSQTEF